RAAGRVAQPSGPQSSSSSSLAPALRSAARIGKNKFGATQAPGSYPVGGEMGYRGRPMREDMVAKHPEEAKELNEILHAYEDDFDPWLGGPEAKVGSNSAEYHAFS